MIQTKTLAISGQAQFLNLSEIDYTYTLKIEPGNPDVLYSGYSRKPFETSAKIRATFDGGATWETLLEVEGAEAITSLDINPQNVNELWAVSTGDSGGKVWKSTDKGATWSIPNEYFNFTTIHSFAAKWNVAFAGVWGGILQGG